MTTIQKICKININEKMEVQLDDQMYEKLINDAKIVPLTYKDLADDWRKNSNEWYHAKVVDEDLPVLFYNPYATIYTWTRCKIVVPDGESEEFHVHALVHFKIWDLTPGKRMQGVRETFGKRDIVTIFVN